MVNLRNSITGMPVVRNPSSIDTADSLNKLVTIEGAPQATNTFNSLAATSSFAIVSQSSAGISSSLTATTVPTIDPSESGIPAPTTSTSKTASGLRTNSLSKGTIAGISVAIAVGVLIALVMLYMAYRLFRTSNSRAPDLMRFPEKEVVRNSVSIRSFATSDSHASCDSDTCSEDEDNLLQPRPSSSSNNVNKQYSTYQALPHSLSRNGLPNGSETYCEPSRLGQRPPQRDANDDDNDNASPETPCLSNPAEEFQIPYLLPAASHVRMDSPTSISRTFTTQTPEMPWITSSSSSPQPYRCSTLSPIIDNFSNGPAPMRSFEPPSYSKSSCPHTSIPSDISLPLPPYSSPSPRFSWESTQPFKDDSFHAQNEAEQTSPQHFIGSTIPSQISQSPRNLYLSPLSPPAPPPPFSPPPIPTARFRTKLSEHRASQSQDSLPVQKHTRRTRASTTSAMYDPVSITVHLHSSNEFANNIQPLQQGKPSLKLDTSNMIADTGSRLARHKSMITPISALSPSRDSLVSASLTTEPQLRRHLSCLSPRATGLPLGFTMSSRAVPDRLRPISNAATTGSNLSPLSPVSPCVTDCTEFSEDSKEFDSRQKPWIPIQRDQSQMPYLAQLVSENNDSSHTSSDTSPRSSRRFEERNYNTDNEFLQDDGISVPFLFKVPINPRSSSLPRAVRTPKPKQEGTFM